LELEEQNWSRAAHSYCSGTNGARSGDG